MGTSTHRDKLASAAEVVCKQGMVPFPVSDTAIAIIDRVVGDNEEELELIDAFREKPSQTIDQLEASSGFSAEKIELLATSLAGKGLIFNQLFYFWQICPSHGRPGVCQKNIEARGP